MTKSVIPNAYCHLYADDTITLKGADSLIALKAVKVGFIVCKGVFVAYTFYCTNQCAFI